MQATPHDIAWGALPRTATYYGDGTFPKHPQRFELINRKLWQPVSLSRHVKVVYSQSDGMCTPNGGLGAMMVERSFRNRKHNPILSPEYAYGQVAKWGDGVALDVVLRQLVEDGCCTREQVPQVDGHLHRSWPDNHKELAGENRVLEAIDLNASFNALATALQEGRPCLIGVRWPGGGGHAICVTELVQVTRATCTNHGRTDQVEWGIGGPNSWSLKWGNEGFYTLTERQADFRQFGGWAMGTST